jgi:uncharacterized protein (DUF2062 family)
MFRRRNKLSLGRRVTEFVWPRAGWWRASKYVVYRVRRLPGSPARIALGFACGAFVAFTPLFGLHYLLALVMAWLLRGSIIAAFLGANIGWFYPFVLVWAYHLGSRLIGSSSTISMPQHPTWEYLLMHPWNVFLPTMIGSIPVALAIASVSFAFAYAMITGYRNFRRHRMARRAQAVPAPFAEEKPR